MDEMVHSEKTLVQIFEVDEVEQVIRVDEMDQLLV